MQIEWQGKTYDYDAIRDLTLSHLRHIKNWYPELAGFQKFTAGYRDGDPDALCCLLWVLMKDAGESPREPMAMADFKVSEFYEAWCDAFLVENKRLQAVIKAAAEADDGTVDPTVLPSESPSTVDSSTEIPKKSEPSTSDSSPTSVTSDPET